MNDLSDELGGELRGFLDAHPDIGAVQIFLTDLCGVLRGKSIRGEELAALYAHGRPVAATCLPRGRLRCKRRTSRGFCATLWARKPYGWYLRA